MLHRCVACPVSSVSPGNCASSVLNTGTAATATTFTVTDTGLTTGMVTPFPTNSGNNIAAQATIALGNGTFDATIPARSLVTYRITH